MKFNLAQSVQILKRTPAVISTLLEDLTDGWIYTNEGPGTWSPFDILGHLIHGEKTDWIPRAEIILSDAADKTFVPFDRFAQNEINKGKSLDDLLEEFRLLRNENIGKLEQMALDTTALEKTGLHPELGLVRLKELLAAWVTHDYGHINQITRVLAKNYKDEIGPWKAYMTVVKL